MPNVYSMRRPPSKGQALGDVIYCTETKQTFVVLGGDLRLYDMAGLLTMQPQPCVGPKGEPGERGLTGPQGPAGKDARNGADSTIPGPRGERGERGAAGRDGDRGKPGIDGKDSFVPGPRGEKGDKGDRGDKGERGDVLIPNSDELSAAVIAYRQKYANIQAALLEEISKSKKLRPSTRLHVQNALNRVKKEAGL